MSSPERPSELTTNDSPPIVPTRKRKREDFSFKCQTPEYDAWLFTAEEVSETPSRLDGIPEHIENQVIAKSARFMIDVGLDMCIPSLTVSVAITFFQRFYMLESVLAHPPPIVAGACLFPCLQGARDAQAAEGHHLHDGEIPHPRNGGLPGRPRAV